MIDQTMVQPSIATSQSSASAHHSSARSSASRSVPTATTSNPSILGGGAPGPARGTIARLKPEPGGLAKASLEAAYRAQLTEQPDLADATVPGSNWSVPERPRQGERQGQVEGRLVEGQAAGEIGVDVVAAQTDAGPPAEHRDQQRKPVLVEAARGSPGVAVGA